MKRISRIRLASVMAILLAVLFSCQTAEPVDTFIPEITASSELPVVLSQSYYGYEVTVSADDGSAVVTYPENVVTISDAEAFLRYEAGKHGEDARHIIYDVSTPGKIILSYPKGSSAEELRNTAGIFLSDIAEYVDSLFPPAEPEAIGNEVIQEPEIIEYQVLGYTAEFTVEDGKTTLVLPPVVLESDVDGFFAYEVAKYGSYVDGIYYRYTGNAVELTYPETITMEDVKLNLPYMVEDIEEYAAMLIVAVEETTPEEPTEIVEEAAAEPEVITYQVLGYTAEFTVEDGKTTLALPPVVLESDVDGFFAYEVAKYGSYVDGIYYRYTGDAVELTYPETITREDVKANLPYMVDDIAEYAATLAVPAEEPEPVVIASAPVLAEPEIIEPLVVRYEYLGNEFTGYIYTGELQMILPEIVTDSDIEGFFASEVEKYGSMLDGVYYRFIPEGVAISYPEDIPIEEIRDVYVPLLAEDIAAYWESLNEPEPVIAEESVEAPEAGPAIEVIAEPEVIAYQVLGYTAEFTVEDGKTTLVLPPVVLESDVDSFFAYEVAKYGSYVDGIYYRYTGDAVELTYPETITREDVKLNLPYMVADIEEYAATLVITEETAPVAETSVPEETVSAEEPEVIAYQVLGYTAEFTVEDGKTTLALPPVVLESDVDGFFAYEVAKYGSYVDGIYYRYTGDAVELTYPETITREDVKLNLPYMVADIEEYAATLMVPATEEIPVMEESVPVEEVAVPEEPVAEEESVEYPFGIQPIVKNDQGSDEFNLIVVHTNDVHGRIEEGDGLIGYSRLSTLLNMARAMTDNVLVLDAGDTFHGTVLANYTEGQTVAEIMDMLGYDAMVPGNHDFNYGFQRLLDIDAWTDDNDSFKVLSANISDESGMLYFQPYQIYSFNGFDVCVIGLTTPDTKLMSHPANTEGVEFISQDIIDNAQRAIDVAHEIADYVIVLGHMGFGPSLPESITSADIASAVDGIDLFIDGHSHTAMDGGERVNGTLIVSAGEYLENIGVVDIHVKDGEAVSEDAFLITADDVGTPAESSFFASMGIKSVLSDPEVDEYVSGKQAELDSVLGRSIGYLPMNLNGEREDVRTRKTNLSKMICDAMAQESGADFSIINGGSIRASLEAGPITAGDILEVLPFENIIVTCEVTPADIYKILELGYSNLPESAGAFTQTDLKIVYSPSASQGERIRRVYLDDVLLDRSDDETVYVVATNDFLAAGGDDFEFGQKLSEGRLISEVFQEYLEKLY